MFCSFNLWQWVQCICRKPGLFVILLLLALFTTPYLIFENYADSNRSPDMTSRIYNRSEDNRRGFLVWNPKCQIIARDPLDPSIRKFVRKEKFEACTKTALMSKIVKVSDSQLKLKLDQKLAKNFPGMSCCWAPIWRPKPTETPDAQIDSEIILGTCTDFKDEVMLPNTVEVILVRCQSKRINLRTKRGKKTVYENVHPILRSENVRKRLELQKRSSNFTKKLSVLILGMDNVSRFNIERSMPITTRYLKETGWTELMGYNKMADNTFPNLMAILTGLNSSKIHEICTPTKSFGLDKCPLIWYAFKNAGYVTAYGEDAAAISTFDYMKTGFVYSPTDFYLRPYIIASEKYLTPKRHLNASHYCTGPESSGDRILNYALEFASTFTGKPYFGFFWTNTMSHDNINGPSSVDFHILSMFKNLEQKGILNDAMVIFLSDHGSRYGPLRETTQGWYEEKLPFAYIWLPRLFAEENPKAFEALRENGRSLTSPFNVYETLRDVLVRGGGESDLSRSCPQCKSLFIPVPPERGCEDVGIGHHWCTCTVVFGNASINGEIVLKGAHKIIEHINNVTKKYTDENGRKICTNLKLKKILKVDEMIESQEDKQNSTNYREFLCQLQATPGNGKFEATIRYQKLNASFTIIDNEVSRINTYRRTAKCLNVGYKEYCYCK